jgi:hypothetical protein
MEAVQMTGIAGEFVVRLSFYAADIDIWQIAGRHGSTERR